jgi:hypothetical protein
MMIFMIVMGFAEARKRTKSTKMATTIDPTNDAICKYEFNIAAIPITPFYLSHIIPPTTLYLKLHIIVEIGTTPVLQ